MKQRITPEQFDELTATQKATLTSWVAKKYGPGRTLYLSIGQMIEFLSESIDTRLSIDLVNRTWSVGKNKTHYWHRFGQSLVTALWSAVKSELR